MRSRKWDLTATVKMDCEWSEDQHNYEIRELTISPLPGGDPISSQLIRTIPVGELLTVVVRVNLELHARAHTPVGEMSHSRVPDAFLEVRDRLKATGPSHETLEWVSLLYEIASIGGRRPTQDVSEAFEIGLRTASNWVRLARAAGLLDG